MSLERFIETAKYNMEKMPKSRVTRLFREFNKATALAKPLRDEIKPIKTKREMIEWIIGYGEYYGSGLIDFFYENGVIE